MALKKVLITGGAGFIGSHVVDRCIQAGVKVLVVDDLSTGNRKNLNPKARFVQLDIRDPKLVRSIRQFHPDAVLHFAAQKNLRVSLEQPLEDASINILGSLALLEAVRLAKVKRFLFASTGGAIYEAQSPRPTPESAEALPLSPYGIGKRSFELYLDAYAKIYKLQAISLRFSNVYGPRQDPKGEAGVVAIFLNAVLHNQRPTIFGRGEKTRDYVYVQDVAEACWRALKSSATGIYNIGTGRETSVTALWNEIARVTKTKIRPIHGQAIPGELPKSSLSARKARTAFHWQPKVNLSRGLRMTYQWFLDHSSR